MKGPDARTAPALARLRSWASPVLAQLRGRSAVSLSDSTYNQQGRGSGFAAPPFAAALYSECSGGWPGGSWAGR